MELNELEVKDNIKINKSLIGKINRFLGEKDYNVLFQGEVVCKLDEGEKIYFVDNGIAIVVRNTSNISSGIRDLFDDRDIGNIEIVNLYNGGQIIQKKMLQRITLPAEEYNEMNYWANESILVAYEAVNYYKKNKIKFEAMDEKGIKLEYKKGVLPKIEVEKSPMIEKIDDLVIIEIGSEVNSENESCINAIKNSIQQNRILLPKNIEDLRDKLSMPLYKGNFLTDGYMGLNITGAREIIEASNLEIVSNNGEHGQTNTDIEFDEEK